MLISAQEDVTGVQWVPVLSCYVLYEIWPDDSHSYHHASEISIDRRIRNRLYQDYAIRSENWFSLLIVSNIIFINQLVMSFI